MTKLLRILLCGIAISRFATVANAQYAWPLSIAAPRAETPLPNVVRIAAPNRDSMSLGSGSLVAVDAQHALVLTNWHVINEAAGVVRVIFPDGFQSGAVVLAADKDWDLAALVIWKPHAQPLPISREIPKPGDPLTIAGYGANSYRTASGRCTQYLSPGTNFPNEIIELSAAARQGDSGGPILNARGELAGVLFGTAGGLTSGSHCGRVSQFLASVETRFRNPSPEGAAAAAANSRSTDSAGGRAAASTDMQAVNPALGSASPTTTASANPNDAKPPVAGDDGLALRGGVAAVSTAVDIAAKPQDPLASVNRAPSSLPYDPLPPLPAGAGITTNPPPAANSATSTVDSSGWDDLVGHTRFEQFKSLLAAVGALAVISQIVRLKQTSTVAKSNGD